jgi:hypothetical protein
MSEINGGSFIQGFAAGALSSIAASAFSGGQSSNIVDGKRVPIAGSGWGGAGKFAHSTVGMIAFGTVMGGAGAALTGGNFWQGAVTGLVVSGLNHAMHQMGSFDDEYDQQGRKVTKETLGIKKGDTKVTMIDKALKGMKVGDYITGEDASFLGEDAKTYIKTITRTGTTSFAIDGDSNWMGVSAFKPGATLEISHLTSPVQLKNGTNLSYKITINGITAAGKVGNVYPINYLGGNTSYAYFGNGYHKIPN